MPSKCKNKCDQYALKPRPPRWIDGLHKYCVTCRRFFSLDGKYCPCCGCQMRRRPHNHRKDVAQRLEDEGSIRRY